MRIDQGVILIGGRGTRLGSLTQRVAKPMLQVGGRPFVEHVISQFGRFGVRKIILLAGHQGALPRERYDGRRLFGIKISVLVEPQPLGTAGALRFAARNLDDVFFLTNGDTFFDTDLLPLIRLTANPDWKAAMLLRRIKNAARYGFVELDPQGVVRAFHEKTTLAPKKDALVNAGTYLIRRDSVIAAIEQTPCSLEESLFPWLVTNGALRGVEASGYFVDIGIPQSLESARLELVDRRTRPAAFLDRDGVLNVDHGYTHRPNQLEWIATAPQAVRLLNRAGYYVIVVSNQAGVARGYYTKDAVDHFQTHMQDMLMAEDAHIDAFYDCPHYPDGEVKKLSIPCCCRKPRPGLLEQAASDWYIDRERSFLIGDKDTDLAAAAAFHIRGIKFDAVKETLTDLVRKEIDTAAACPAAQ